MLREQQLELLVAKLDSPHGTVGEDAGFDLYDLGACVIELILRALPNFGIDGWVEGLDCLSRFSIPQLRAAPVQLYLDALIPILEQEHNGFVLGEAVCLLEVVEAVEAIDALKDTRSRLIKAGEGPDWTERSAIRCALTELGARQEVFPQVAFDLMHKSDADHRVWAWEHVPRVIDALAEESQMLLTVSPWRRAGHSLYRLDQGHWSNESLFEKPWAQEVEDAREAATEEVLTAPVSPRTYAMLDWLQRADLDE